LDLAISSIRKDNPVASAIIGKYAVATDKVTCGGRCVDSYAIRTVIGNDIALSWKLPTDGVVFSVYRDINARIVVP
jgi:hypothetical protein